MKGLQSTRRHKWLRACLRIMALPILLLVCLCAVVVAAQFSITKQANGEMALSMPATAGTFHRIETTNDPVQWTPMMTLQSGATLTHTDSAAPYHAKRFYRSTELTGTGILTGDHISTSAGEVIVHPLFHASFVMSWNGKMIYVDPVPITPSPYASLPKADLILVTHSHNDHYVAATLTSVLNTGGRIIVPKHVYDMTSFAPFRTGPGSGIGTYLRTGQAIPANNDPPVSVIGVTVEGVPAYNTTGTIYHQKGDCNGYVLTIGDKRIFISGDTGDTPEMRALPNIDVAFVCINEPFTMTVPAASSVVRAFKPKVVFPYHFRNSNQTIADLVAFKQTVGTDLGIEVRIRTWY